MAQVENGRAPMNWRELQTARGKEPGCSMEDLLARGNSAGN
jgi:hypothetical protein